MKLLLIFACLFITFMSLPSFAQGVPPLSEEELVNEEGTPSEYALPLGEVEMERADLERQEDIISPDDANSDWNMDDVVVEEDL